MTIDQIRSRLKHRLVHGMLEERTAQMLLKQVQYVSRDLGRQISATFTATDCRPQLDLRKRQDAKLILRCSNGEHAISTSFAHVQLNQSTAFQIVECQFSAGP